MIQSNKHTDDILIATWYDPELRSSSWSIMVCASANEQIVNNEQQQDGYAYARSHDHSYTHWTWHHHFDVGTYSTTYGSIQKLPLTKGEWNSRQSGPEQWSLFLLIMFSIHARTKERSKVERVIFWCIFPKAAVAMQLLPRVVHILFFFKSWWLRKKELCCKYSFWK